MKLHDEIQGTPEWAALRTRYYTASEAAAMMGCHPTKQRNELLREKKTGIVAEVSDFVESRVFAPGHETEAMARPLAEAEIGDDLYPVVGSLEVDGLPLLSSFDGLTMDYRNGYEHKLWSEEIAGHIAHAGEPPLYYVWQLEQQLLVSGGRRILFVTSDGTPDKWAQCWYASKPERRAALIAGWKQFAKDLAVFVPSAAEVKPTGKAPEALPALHIVINGGVSASNLDEFKETALGAIRGVNRELTTDVHFADAEKAVKWCGDIEDRIKAAKEHALGQTASIDALFRTMDEISAEARRVRLDLEKLVKARKESIKGEIVASGVAAFAKYIRELNAAMPADYMPTVPADFGGAIKGLRTIDSITNAVDTELARVKIAAGEIATRIHANIGKLDAANAPQLFAFDISGLVLKNPDDLANVIALRLDQDAKRKEAERARILAEEKAREEREHAVDAERIERQQADRDPSMDGLAFVMPAQATAAAAAPAQEQATARVQAGFVRNSAPAAAETEDNGARLTLGQLNDRLAPISISVAGLSTLGFDPVEQVKASRLYRECDLPAICRAIADHALAAAEQIGEAV